MNSCICHSSVKTNNESNGKHYILLKYIKKGYFRERKVFIKKYPNKGTYIVVQSLDGTEKEKNKIGLFLINPMDVDNIIVGKENRRAAIFKRHNEYPLILTSNNEILLDLFIDEVNKHINETNKFQYYLSKWSYFMTNDSVRILSKMMYKLKLDRVTNEKDSLLNGKIDGYSHKFLISSLRYFSFNLKHGPMGYSKIQRIMFNIWKSKWKKECISYDLEKKYNSLKQYMDLFSVLDINNCIESEFNIFSFKNTLNDLFQKTSRINKDLDRIGTNLSNLCYDSHGHTTEKKMDIVKNLQKMADLYHNIQYIRNECEEFVIIGDQSSGKSCLLSMLLGVNVAYSDDKFATRCPVRYLLEPCDPQLGWQYEFENPQTKEFQQVSQEELQKRLIHHFKKIIGKRIVMNPINIKVYSPICSSTMTLVDLPGLVGLATNDKDKEDQHKMSNQIVREYLSKVSTCILFVQRFDVDIGSLNTEILEEVQKKPPENVLYCLTHFDRYCSDLDVSIENVSDLISKCNEEISQKRNMFLLSLSKKVEDLEEKEESVKGTIELLKNQYSEYISGNNIHFNIQSLKNHLRRKIHRNVLEVDKVIYQYVNQEKKNIINIRTNINKSLADPYVNGYILDKFLDIFKDKTNKLLKGHFIPDKENQNVFFEDIQTEIHNANQFCRKNNISIWPMGKMASRYLDDKPDTGKYINKLDNSLRRDIVSHALFTRTVYELQERLWSIDIYPSEKDIIYGITSDPNINLDGPKDSIHFILVYTIQKQLHIGGFFNYMIKRLEYVLFKILKYVLWEIANSADTEVDCLLLLQKKEFQYILEIEIHKYVKELTEFTINEMISIFNEVVNAPIVLNLAQRYKEVLINDFGWSAIILDECSSGEILKSKHIDIDISGNDCDSERTRIQKIQNLIKLHIHIRLIMLSEHMIRCVDYNWRRMLDNTKENTINHNSYLSLSIYEYLKKNVFCEVSIEGEKYNREDLFKIYSGNQTLDLRTHTDKIDLIHENFEGILQSCEGLNELLNNSINIAGKQFL